MSNLEIEAYFQKNITLLSDKYCDYHRFAFWHDVGVTALSALATALLTIKKDTVGYDFIANSIAPFITLLLPFLTGLVTVFVACDHFFKFRSKADSYEDSLLQLYDLQEELKQCLCNAEEKSIKGKSVRDVYQAATEIMSRAKVLPVDVDDRVFKCRRVRCDKTRL